MSIISKALKKIQEARQNNQERKVGDIVYLADAPKSWLKTSMIGLLAAGIVAAILISTSAHKLILKNYALKQDQMLRMERVIKSQQQKIDSIIASVNKNQAFTDKQISDLKTQINDLTSTENTHYDNLKEAILDDKQQIEAMSIANNNAKNTASVSVAQ
jgi:hypothetical protein